MPGILAESCRNSIRKTTRNHENRQSIC
jgi:hypothetical protein